MASTVIDRFVTVLGYKSKFGGLRAYERETNRAVDRISAKVGTLGTVLSSAGKGITIAGAALTGALVAVLAPAVGFEQALNRTAAVMEVTRKETKALEAQALSLGSTTSEDGHRRCQRPV